MRLSNKVAVVTGGGSGMGAAICRRFVEEGARVVIVDCRPDRGEPIARSFSASATFVEADVSRDSDAKKMIDTAVDRFGRLDVLVNNAGAPQPPTPITETSEADFDRLIAVNAKAIFLAARHAVPVMRRQGGGIIINTVSVAAIRPRPNLTAYNSSKGAALVMTKSLAIELAPDRIRVNAVCPGPADTPMLSTFVGGDSPEKRAAFLSTIPLGRLCAPEDVANAMVYLASEEASFVTGAVLDVDGGRCI